MTSYSLPAGARHAVRRTSVQLLVPFVIAYAVGLVFIYFDLRDGRGTLQDVDDQMRQLQLQQFLFGGAGWWDLRLPMIAMPEEYVSPWSRLVDAPYILISLLLAPVLGAKAAFSLSLAVWPPVMLAIFCFQMVYVHHLLKMPASLVGYAVTGIAAFCSYFAIWEFEPGRIDHHNAQILVLMTMIIGALRWNRSGGFLIGLGALLSVAIALEGLPFLIIIFAGLVLAFVFSVEGAKEVVRWAAGTVVVLTLPAAFVLIGPANIVSTQCDTFSAPYIYLLIGFCGILWAATAVQSKNAFLLILGMGVSSIVLLAAFTILFPQCLQGPYWMINPVAKNYWFNRVSQEQSIVYYLNLGQIGAVQLMAFFLSALVLAMPVMLTQRSEGWVGALILLVVACFSLIATVLLMRYVRFVFAFAPLTLPAVIRFFTSEGRSFSKSFRYGLIFAVLLFVAAPQAARLWPVMPDRFDAADFIGSDECRRGDFSPLNGVPPGRIMATHVQGASLALSLPPGFSVAAVPFHRASPGMKRMFEAFLSSDPAVRRNALAPFDYVAICRFPMKADYGTAPLYDALSAGKDWPGLIRLPTGADNPFQLFRIDHAALQ